MFEVIELGIIFSVAFCAVLLELLQMKYLNVLLNSTSGFLIITLALLMFSLSAGALSLFARLKTAWLFILSRIFEGLFLLSTVGSLIGLRYMTYIEGVQVAAQEVWFSAVLLGLIIVPYFFGGWVLVHSLKNRHQNSSFIKAYSVDLCGVLSAAFLPHFLIGVLGPEKLMAVALVLPCLFILFRQFTQQSKNNDRIVTWSSLSCAIIFIGYVLFFVSATEPLNPVVKKFKPETYGSQLELSQWDPISRIDIVDFGKTEPASPDSAIKYLFYDGGTIGTNIYRFDGDYNKLKQEYPRDPQKYFLRRATPAAHLLKEGTGPRVFLLGAGAGQELKAALMYGASYVVANELNETVNQLNLTRYSEYNGGIFKDSRVLVVGGDGRKALSQTTGQYDIIQIFSVYLSANMALGLSPHAVSYLFTEESLNEYIDRLSDDGILQLNQFRYRKLLQMLSAVWKKRKEADDLRRHIFVIESSNKDDFLTTVLFKKSRFTSDEAAKLKWLFQDSVSGDESYDWTEHPLNDLTKNSFFAHEELYKKPITDNWPFFAYNGKSYFNEYGLNQITFWVAMGLLLLVGIFLLRTGWSQWVLPDVNMSKIRWAFIFFISGITFIYFQYVISTRLLKYLYSSDLGYPVVICSFAAVGTMYCFAIDKVQIWFQNQRRLKIYFIGAIIFVLAFALDKLLWEQLDRVENFSFSILILTAAVFVSAALASFCFPVAMRLSASSNGDISAPWILNGLGLLVGSLSAQPLVLALGLQNAWLICGSLVVMIFGLFA